jgi:hypothetical protein
MTLPNLSIALTGAVASLLAGTATAEGSGTTTVTCASVAGERQHCAANTNSGIVMARSTGAGACLLGRSWGYDDAGVWVQDGCAGEFIVAAKSPSSAPAVAAAAPTTPAAEPALSDTAQAVAATTAAEKPFAFGPELKEQPEAANETYGYLDPGKGFLIGKTPLGELSLSAYALVRYMNQEDPDGVFTDHLGRERPVDGRHDIYSHRVLAWMTGWLGNPRLRYTITSWTVNTTDQDALFANIGYQFNDGFNLYAGVFGNNGSRSMLGSHPYWLGHDRVMADEFFRPFFTQGLYANGQLLPKLWYSVGMGNTSSTLGTTAVQLDRKFTYSGTLWWMPTTGEFGPRGGYGDWEHHEELATRFGLSFADSPEQRYTDVDDASGNTVIKLADSVNAFETGALVPGVTITELDYRDVAMDFGFKYKGFFLQTEFYYRWLDNFKADGFMPVNEIEDWGFYVQGSFFAIPRTLEVYGATSQIYGDDSLGFDKSSEYILGLNWYPMDTRNHRVNVQYMNINKSPVGSTFGYYTAGQDGDTLSVAASVFF